MRRIIAGLLILATPLLVGADPSLYRAVYKADYKGLPVSAEGIRELSRDASGTYTLTSTATSFFAKISESSEFTIKDKQIIPIKYQYHRSGIGKKRAAILSFDWTEMKVLNNVQEKPWEMNIPPGTLDKLVYQLNMREDLQASHANQQPWPALNYKVADGGKLKSYQFKVLGEEDIETPIGKFHTVKATRVRHNKSRKTTFWLAPEYEFLLVRFQQLEENGRGFELLLKEAEFDGRTL